MMRAFVISLWMVALFWAACKNDVSQREVLNVPDPVALNFSNADRSPLQSGGTSLQLSVSSGPDTYLEAFFADNFGYNVRYHSLKPGLISLATADSAVIFGLDSVDIRIRPANRENYFPLAYLANPVDSAGAPSPLELRGFELANFLPSFSSTLAGQLHVELFFAPGYDVNTPVDYVLNVQWDVDASYKVPK